MVDIKENTSPEKKKWNVIKILEKLLENNKLLSRVQ